MLACIDHSEKESSKYEWILRNKKRTIQIVDFNDVFQFLRTARSFYESRWYLLTYARTYVQVIFRRSHPTLKLIKQKTSKYYKSMFQFFLFCRNPKNDQVRAKQPILGPKNQNQSVQKSS